MATHALVDYMGCITSYGLELHLAYTRCLFGLLYRIAFSRSHNGQTNQRQKKSPHHSQQCRESRAIYLFRIDIILAVYSACWVPRSFQVPGLTFPNPAWTVTGLQHTTDLGISQIMYRLDRIPCDDKRITISTASEPKNQRYPDPRTPMPPRWVPQVLRYPKPLPRWQSVLFLVSVLFDPDLRTRYWIHPVSGRPANWV